MPLSAPPAAWRRMVPTFPSWALWVLVAVSVAWGAGFAVFGAPLAWRDGQLVSWLWRQLIGESLCTFAVVLAIAIPVALAREHGPRSGWRRHVLLAIVVALASLAACLVRFGYLKLTLPPTQEMSITPLRLWRWWQRYAPLAGLLTLAAEFHWTRLRRLEDAHRADLERETLDRELTEARLQVLQAQIEPHFLFNTLATVRRLCQTDAAAGRAMFDNLMEVLRVAMPRMREPAAALGSELELLDAYLALHKVRMGRRLNFRLEAADEVADERVPPMMLLTLVENAVKHGLGPLPEGGFIQVSAHGLDARRWVIEVADTGRGLSDDSTGGSGTGLANIRARLATIDVEGVGLTIGENQPRGVIASLVLPRGRATG